MKRLKKQIIWSILMAIAGITLIAISMFRGIRNSTTLSFAAGLTVVSIMKLVQFYRISKNPSLLKKYEIEQKEERFIAIAQKSGNFTLMVTLIAEGAAIFIFLLMSENTLATIVSSVAGIQTFVYIISYYYFCKKY